MSEHFIKNIEIDNFKCFNSFKAEGFKRVNLIGGKNNVGKTAFMEACKIGINAEDIKGLTGALVDIKISRENINILTGLVDKTLNINDKMIQEFLQPFSGLKLIINNQKKYFFIKEKLGIKSYSFNINNELLDIKIKDFLFEGNVKENLRFIDNFGLSSSNIIKDFSAIQKKDEESFLNNIINQFDSNIKSFKIIDDKPQCKMNDNYYEITEFGDGLRHIISIVIELFKCEDGHLFIDEIDNGIHYTQLDEIWKIIFQISDKLDVQIFATTHSKECIDSYARVAKKLKDENTTFIALGRDKESQLKAIVMKSERFNRELRDGNGVRGW